MDSKKIAKQMVSFQKAIFDNSFYGLTIFQDHSQNMTDGFLRQFPWISPDSKKPLAESIKYMNVARENYKKAVDMGFAQLEDVIDGKYKG